MGLRDRAGRQHGLVRGQVGGDGEWLTAPCPWACTLEVQKRAPRVLFRLGLFAATDIPVEKVSLSNSPTIYQPNNLCRRRKRSHNTTKTDTRSMAKRAVENDEKEWESLKHGDRPLKLEDDEAGEFADEFEDEFESEDEIFEAGVDGRPDEEREAEEREGSWAPPVLCSLRNTR